MYLSQLRVANYRSAVDTRDFRMERFQAFVGANNTGKSNLLTAIDIFLSAGAGGVKEADFYDVSKPIVITGTFTQLTEAEKGGRLRRYLLGDKLIIEKQLAIQEDARTGKKKVTAEYHGYLAKPKEWWLDIDKIQEHLGTARPDWNKVAEEHGIIDYVKDGSGRVTKASYAKGIERLILERDDIEYDEPVPGETQALGLQPELLAHLPKFFLLPAITDYSDEIDRRSSSTVFRQLMGNLAERAIRLDPKYAAIEDALTTINRLLNRAGEDATQRLEILGKVELVLTEAIQQVMPGVSKVQLKILLDETAEIFSRGVQLAVDDGVLTDVLAKGHGLQRCVVYGLLKTLIDTEKGLFGAEQEQGMQRPIILAIEEPELYIHPQIQRLIYRVLRSFAETAERSDQVVYATHAPAFLDVGRYHEIGVIRKDSVTLGTRVHQCDAGVLGSGEERKGFQLINSFGVDKNHVFFAQESILVEGQQDEIAIIAAGRKMRFFTEFPEEEGFSIVNCESKEEIPKFQKVLNAFRLPYVVLLELDGKPENEGTNKAILDLLCGNRCIKHAGRLEGLCGKDGHFSKTYDAMCFFRDPENISPEVCDIVKQIFDVREELQESPSPNRLRNPESLGSE